ncbi:hypothetical protein [Krasilnikovia cinnamomea]|nr:hypothetical protein [Krasilnikovia cinnamomea]
MGLPSDARVIVEAQNQTNYMRFQCGRVGDIVHLDNVALTEFDSHQGIGFRVKVIGDSEADLGKLLAVADRLRVPHDAGEGESPTTGAAARESILPFKAQDLEQLTWKLDTSDDRPIVYVNRNLPNWRDFVGSAEFRALVLPAVLREIAIWMLRQQDVDEAEPGDPVWPWKRFVEGLGWPTPQAHEEDKFETWVDEVVFAFTRRAHLFDDLLAVIDTEAEQ